jgi:hypothetical protein
MASAARCNGEAIADPDQAISHKLYWDTEPMAGPAPDQADCATEEWPDPTGVNVIDLAPNIERVQFGAPNGSMIYIRTRAIVAGVPSALSPEVMIETPAAPVSAPNRPVLWVTGQFDDLTAAYGPVSQPTLYPSNATIQGAQRFRITGVITQLGVAQGLVSRDASGQDIAGHFTVSVDEAGLVKVRNQPGKDAAGASLPSAHLASTQPIVAGQPFGITVSLGPINGLVLAVDGQDPVTSTEFHPLHTNTLPVVVGGVCSSCLGDSGAPIKRPISGTVRVQVFAAEQ